MSPPNIFDEVLSEPTTTDVFSGTGTAGQPDIFADILGTGQPVFDPSVANSWGNRFAIATDQMQQSMWSGLGVIADVLQDYSPESAASLKQYSLEGIQRNIEQITSKPQPTRSAEITEAWTDIRREMDEGDVTEALLRGAAWLKDATAEALPSLGTTGAALVGGTLVGGAVATTAGLVGIGAGTAAAAGGTVALLAPLVPGFLMGSGQTYEEAIARGATPEEAENYALAAGGAIGILDRVGAAAVLRGVMKAFGKDMVVKSYAKKGIGKEIVEQADDNAKKILEKPEFIKESIAGVALKTAAQAGVVEAATEAGQEAIQIAGAGLAAEQGLNPYSGIEYNKRLINAGALGFVGGKTAGLGVGTLTGIQRRNAVKQAQEIEEAIEKIKADQPVDEKGKKQEFTKDELIALREKLTKEYKPSLLKDLVSRATSPLTGFASRSPLGLQVVNMFDQYYNNVSSDIGNYADAMEAALGKVRRTLKLPVLQRSMSKRKNDEIFRVLSRDESGVAPLDNPNATIASDVREAATIFRRDVLGELISPELKITKDTLIEALKNDLETLPEIEAIPDDPEQVGATPAGMGFTVGQPSRKLQLRELYNQIRRNYKSILQPGFTVGEIPAEVRGVEGGMGFILNADKNLNLALSKIAETEAFQELQDTVAVEFEATGLFGELAAAGLEVGFVAGYFPRLYKVATPWQRRRMKKILAQQLNENGNPRGEVWANEIIDNMRGNEGVYVPDTENLSLDIDKKNPRTFTDSPASFEKNRTITDETFAKLNEAGLVEKNIKAVLDKYILQASRRKRAKELKDFVVPALKTLRKQGEALAANEDEVSLMKNIYDAIQHRYKPIKYEGMRKAQRMFLTYQYMLTLPLAALTAMSEPFIVLSRVKSGDAMFGAAQAAQNTLRQGLRSIFPKIKRSEAEQAFNSILQGYDGTLAERLGDISGVEVSRFITDKFFKTILLTQITQFSRDIAFQAGQRQLKRDISTLTRSNITGDVTRGDMQAKKRLAELGLVDTNMRLEDSDSEVLAWLNDETGATPPALIRKAMSKFVDEIIMAPNVVNRPMWMSKPHLALVAQLKGFMMTFGNTVGGRFWREVMKPLARGRVPLDEAARYGAALMLIVAASIAIREMKDEIRYGDEPSAWKDSKGWRMWRDALVASNIFGPGTFLYDALNASKYGASPLVSIAGPGASQIERLLKALDQATSNSPRALATAAASSVPLLGAVFPTQKVEFADIIEEIIPGGE